MDSDPDDPMEVEEVVEEIRDQDNRQEKTGSNLTSSAKKTSVQVVDLEDKSIDLVGTSQEEEEETTAVVQDGAERLAGKKRSHDVFQVDSEDEQETTEKPAGGGDDSDSSIDFIEEKRKVKVVWQCIEPDCTEASRSELVTADSFILAHFSLADQTDKKRKICRSCREKLHDYRDHLVERVRRKETLTDQTIAVPRDVVRLEDSEKEETDSDDTDVELLLSDDDGQLAELNAEQALIKIFEDVREKLDLDGQISNAIKELSDRLDALEPDRQYINDTFQKNEKEIEKMREKLYSPWEPTRQETQSLDIPTEEQVQPPPPPPGQSVLRNPTAPLARPPRPMLLTPQQRPPAMLQRQQQVQRTLLGQKARLNAGQQRPVASKSMGRPLRPGQPRPGLSRPGQMGPARALGHQVPQPALNLPYVPPNTPGLAWREFRTPLTIGTHVFHLRGNSSIRVWKEGQVDEVIDTIKDGSYKIRFDATSGGKKVQQTKLRTLKQLAYGDPAPVKLTVGTRCIGLYQSEEPDERPNFYAGIIAEPPKSTNQNRYLVFFDDGVAQYIIHNNIRVVCFQAEGWPQKYDKVYEEIHPISKAFIEKYLTQYPERPMVKLSVGQVVKAEFEEKWNVTRVIKVDASLVYLEFDLKDKSRNPRKEWLYRGSTRLGPLFTELENQKLKQADIALGGLARRRAGNQAAHIEYTRQVNDSDLSVAPGGATDADGAPVKKMNVARKSMGGNRARNDQQRSATPTTRWEMEGRIIQADISEQRAHGKVFTRHSCSPKCVASPDYVYREEKLRNINTLLIPIILGWDRQIDKQYGLVGNRRVSKTRTRKVEYIAPCGRSLRNLDEVHRYLRITKCALEIDFFNFDWYLKIYDEWEPVKINYAIKDLSYGKENVAVACVNSVNNEYPEYIDYSTVRIPKEKVFINTDKEFLVGCDCEDDCQDKDSCACQQLTIEATACDPGGKIDNNAGYKFRRLLQAQSAGIYECNMRCKCAKTCLNRVVQHPLRTKLQVFKTEKRGWGVRTLTDLPKGAFICIYVGNLFESEEGNKQGQNFGDEYFADLDLIDTCERQKEGYESDVSDEDDPSPIVPLASHPSPTSTTRRIMEDISTEEEDEDTSEEHGDQDFNPQKKINPRNTDRVSRSRINQMDGGLSPSSSDSEEPSLSNFEPSSRDSDEPSSSGDSDKPSPPKKARPATGTSAAGLSSPNRQRVDINSLIHKPDPFEAGLAVPGSGGPCFVMHPSQVDGGVQDDSDDDIDVLEEKRRRPLRPEAAAGMQAPKNTKTFKSTRRYFGRNEDAYIMDAKSIGNVGRYLNHCCEPNSFVQSVFVDTHDLRFHWVSFFTSTRVIAGTELTWDYNYQVGTIPGKELYCECGAENCRGRLL